MLFKKNEEKRKQKREIKGERRCGKEEKQISN
jgi:hypothetical protein